MAIGTSKLSELLEELSSIGRGRSARVVLLVFMLSACASRTRRDWAEPQRLGHGSCPRLVVAPDGNAIAMWIDGDGSSRSIWVDHFDIDSGWGDPELLYEAELDAAPLTEQLELATNAQGQAIAVWLWTWSTSPDDRGAAEVWSLGLEPDTGWGPVALLNRAADEQAVQLRQISAGLADDGTATVVFSTRPQSTQSLWVTRHTATALDWSPAEALFEGGAGLRTLSAATGPGGDTMIAWADSSLSGWVAHIEAAQALPEAERLSELREPFVLASGGDGSYVLAWQSGSVQTKRFDPEQGWAQAIEIDSEQSDALTVPALVVDGYGRGLSAWATFQGMGGGNARGGALYASRVNDEGTWQAREPIALDANAPRLAINDTGDAVAMWWRSGDFSVWSSRQLTGESWSKPEAIADLSSAAFSVGMDSQGNSMLLASTVDGEIFASRALR